MEHLPRPPQPPHLPSPAPRSRGPTLRRLCMILLVLLVGIFTVGQVAETLLVDSRGLRLIFDLLGWSLFSGMAIWLSLKLIRTYEQDYQAELTQSLQQQRELNLQLQRTNGYLELLSAVNQHIATSSTLDSIFDSALRFPQRLVPGWSAALLLYSPTGAIEVRRQGAEPEILADLREWFGTARHATTHTDPVFLPAPDQSPPHKLTPPPAACLVLPLYDGLTLHGWGEFYLAHSVPPTPDELELLKTISSEIAEAITSSRRRVAAERGLLELEQAIAEERARIARDIHDGIAQSLAFVRMRVDLWREWIHTDPARLDQELVELKQTTRELIRELRRAIFALRPVQFDEFGFVGGLHRYIHEFAGQHAWDAHVDLSHAPSTLPLELEAVCFRVVQEALTNIAKHANATRVAVQIRLDQQILDICVRDNGRGFDPDAITNTPDYDSSKVGLRQMAERLAAVGGQISISSSPTTGTELHARMPVPTA